MHVKKGVLNDKRRVSKGPDINQPNLFGITLFYLKQ